MSDLVMPTTNTIEENEVVTQQETLFQGKDFPSDKEIEELYKSELSLGTAHCPLSVIYYTDKDERNAQDSANIDLRGALQEQAQVISLLQRESVDDTKFRDVISVIKSPSGWKEIAYMLNDMKFGEKTLAYLEGRLGIHIEEFRSVDGTVKLLRANLKQQAANGA